MEKTDGHYIIRRIKMKKSIRAMIGLLALVLAPVGWTQPPVIPNGNFQTGDMTNWTTTDSASLWDESGNATFGFNLAANNKSLTVSTTGDDLDALGSCASAMITLPSNQPCAIEFDAADSGLQYIEGVYVKKASDDSTLAFVPAAAANYPANRRHLVYPLLNSPGQSVYVLFDDQRVDAQAIAGNFTVSYVTRILDDGTASTFDSDIWASTVGFTRETGTGFWPSTNPLYQGAYVSKSQSSSVGTRLLKSKPFPVVATDTSISFYGVGYCAGVATFARLRDASNNSLIEEIRVGKTDYQYWYSHSISLASSAGKNVTIEFEITGTDYTVDIPVFLGISGVVVTGTGPLVPVELSSFELE
jgi:hypothetical protein